MKTNQEMLNAVLLDAIRRYDFLDMQLACMCGAEVTYEMLNEARLLEDDDIMDFLLEQVSVRKAA